MERIRRIGAYGMLHDDHGRVLLARGSARSAFPGVWSLPGGGVEHGEHPAHTVVREFAEETGLTVVVTGLRDVTADVCRLPGTGLLEHSDRIVYDVAVHGGELRDERHGTTDGAAWLDPAGLDGTPLLPFTAEALGRSPAELVLPAPAAAIGAPAADPDRGQRFGAYGLVTDPAGRVLLTQIAAGFPGAGRWHLPGGGTDHGERPADAALRELTEETGQTGRIICLLEVSHRHDPAALGPEGRPMDWHAVRVVFRIAVDLPTGPVVTEAAGGSTCRAGWFDQDRLATVEVTDVAASALRWLTTESDTNDRCG